MANEEKVGDGGCFQRQSHHQTRAARNMDLRWINCILHNSIFLLDVYQNTKRIYVLSTVNLMGKKVEKYDRVSDVTGYKTANKFHRSFFTVYESAIQAVWTASSSLLRFES